MNRQQKRNLDKALRTKGFGTVVDAMKSAPKYVDGDKVTIDYEQITHRKDYVSKTDRYKDFLVANRDKVFTVHRVNAMKDHSLVELVEDETEPKWLWWDGDLRRVDREEA